METKSKRSIARQYAFKFLYRYNLPGFIDDKNNFDLELTEKLMTEFDLTYIEKDKEHPENDFDLEIKTFANQLVIKVLSSFPSIEETLKTYLRKWKIEKLDKVDLTILLMGTHEMKNEMDIPEKVIINEYVEMAKCYGTAESYSFANGILDQMAKDLRKK